MQLIHRVNRAFSDLTGFKVSRALSRLERKELPIELSQRNGRRLIYFQELIQRTSGVSGDVVECGVGWGRSLLMLLTALEYFKDERKVIGCDSFEGFPEPSDEDEARERGIEKGRYKTSDGAVLAFLQNSGVSEELLRKRLRLVPGFFSESLPRSGIEQVSLLHLDVDLYQSYVDCLNYFYPRMPKGGIIAFDEYQDTVKFPGAKKAIDEFFAGKPEKVVHVAAVDRYHVVKI